MIQVAKNILKQISFALNQMTDLEYTQPVELFSGASISQHTRHIIEFYTCAIDSRDTIINFDSRQRDQRIEQDRDFSLQIIDSIISNLDLLKEDKAIIIEAQLGGQTHLLQSSLHRELLYVVEHAVHHMAIIKMGVLLNFPHICLAPNFGVAESTLEYRKQCAQ